MRHTIEAVRTELSVVWSMLDDGAKAALRTAAQTFQGAAVVAMFAVASSVVAWASGADVDLLEAVSVGRTAIGVAAISAIASIRAYYMNRGANNGARYD